MLSVVFSKLQKTAPKDKAEYYWDIASQIKGILGHSTVFIRDGELEGQLVFKDVLLIFPGFTEDKQVLRYARKLGIIIVRVPSCAFSQAVQVLDEMFRLIEEKKIP